jgi:hypothetical protein
MLAKTHIYSSVLQERLAGLSTLLTEHEIAQNVDVMELLSTVANWKHRKQKF